MVKKLARSPCSLGLTLNFADIILESSHYLVQQN